MVFRNKWLKTVGLWREKGAEGERKEIVVGY